MPGRLIYMMGPSGAGKDSMLRLARSRLSDRTVFLQRYITRSAASEAEAERHIPISMEDFRLYRDRGFFSLHWESHGNGYGVDKALDRALAAERTVVLNGSRACLDMARSFYPGLVPVLVRVDPGVLRERLTRRGRESGPELEERLRGASLPVVGDDIVELDNSGSLEAAVAFLMRIIER